MDFLTVFSALSKISGIKRIAYAGIGIAIIVTFGYLGLTYHSAISNANTAKSQIIELKDEISDVRSEITKQYLMIDKLKASVEFRDETIQTLKNQMDILGKGEAEAEKKRKESIKKFEDILSKYKDFDDNSLSPKLINILNDLEGVGDD